MNDFKNYIIIILLVLIFCLLYFIMIGRFCSCGRVMCPNYCPDPMRAYLI